MLFYWFDLVYNNNNHDKTFSSCQLPSFDQAHHHGMQQRVEWNATTQKLLASVRTRQTYGTTTSVVEFPVIRNLMHQVLVSTLQPKSFLLDRIPHPKVPCLGVWIQDPGYIVSSKTTATTTQSMVPRDWPRDELYLYLRKFQQAGGTCLYVATDSHAIWNQVIQDWKTRLGAIYTQERAVRNYGSTKAHWMVDHIERLGSETLVDILCLATTSQVLVHSPHVIAEAALYWNPNVISIPIGSKASKDTNKNFDDWLANTFLSKTKQNRTIDDLP
jgi:hypothetical protein